MKKIYKALIIGASFSPMLAFALDFNTFIERIKSIITSIIPVIIGVAVLIFIWGVVKFVSSAGDEEKRAEGRNFMIWGLVGIAVITAVWGLVQILITAFGFAPGQVPLTPPKAF